MLTLIEFAFFVACVLTAYAFWVRPILRSRPALKLFVDRTDSLWAAVCLKLQGIKQKLSGAILMAASAIVAVHDFLLPYVLGVDWTPVTREVPSWAWPFIIFALTFLLDRGPIHAKDVRQSFDRHDCAHSPISRSFCLIPSFRRAAAHMLSVDQQTA